jgi:hypothetical protein
MLVGGLAVYYTDAIWLRVTACRINRQTGGPTNAVYSEMFQTTDIQLTEKKSSHYSGKWRHETQNSEQQKENDETNYSLEMFIEEGHLLSICHYKFLN